MASRRPAGESGQHVDAERRYHSPVYGYTAVVGVTRREAGTTDIGNMARTKDDGGQTRTPLDVSNRRHTKRIG